MRASNKCPTLVPVLYHGTELLSSDQEKVKASTPFSQNVLISVPSDCYNIECLILKSG